MQKCSLACFIFKQFSRKTFITFQIKLKLSAILYNVYISSLMQFVNFKKIKYFNAKFCPWN